MIRTALCGRLRSALYLTRGARSLNIFSIFSKEAVEKERLRLKDEFNRGYFDDYRDMKKHGGKLLTASETLLPIIASVRFPTINVKMANGKQLLLPSEKKSKEEYSAHATLLCLAFRASAQDLVRSWISPFVKSFNSNGNVRAVEVFCVDSWFLSLAPVRSLLLQAMQGSEKKSNDVDMTELVYAFGDSYDFRKALQITNLLTGYIYLLDSQSRVRWRAYGKATDDEVTSMVACTQRLLDEQKGFTKKEI